MKINIHNKITVMFLRVVVSCVAFWSLSGHGEMVNGEELVDPTLPLNIGISTNTGRQLPGTNNLELSSILIRDDFRIAVINSQRYRIGDRIGSGEIVDISNASVTLNMNSAERILFLHENTIKRRNESSN